MIGRDGARGLAFPRIPPNNYPSRNLLRRVTDDELGFPSVEKKRYYRDQADQRWNRLRLQQLTPTRCSCGRIALVATPFFPP